MSPCTCHMHILCVWARKTTWVRGQETVEQQKGWGRLCLRLYTRASDKLSQQTVLFCAASHAFHLFRAHLQKSVLGNGEPGFVCLGQDGTVWSSLVVEVFFFLEPVSVKTLVSAYFLPVPESKHHVLQLGSKMMYVLITVCPKNLPRYVISVSILCKLRKHLFYV